MLPQLDAGAGKSAGRELACQEPDVLTSDVLAVRAAVPSLVVLAALALVLAAPNKPDAAPSAERSSAALAPACARVPPGRRASDFAPGAAGLGPVQREFRPQTPEAQLCVLPVELWALKLMVASQPVRAGRHSSAPQQE